MTITPNTPRWAELVRNGQASDAKRNWFLGDAALEIAPLRTEGRPADNSYSGRSYEELLAQYSDEVGVGQATLKRCREVAIAWPADKRTIKTSWKAYSILAAADKQHLLVDGMTTTQASLAAGHSNPGRLQSERDKELEAAKAEVRAEVEAEVAVKVAEQVEAKVAEIVTTVRQEVEQVKEASKKDTELAAKKAADAERNQRIAERRAVLTAAGTAGAEAGRKAGYATITDAQLKVGIKPEAPAGDVGDDAEEIAAYRAGVAKGYTEAWNVKASEYRKTQDKLRAEKYEREQARRQAVANRKSRLESDRKAWAIDPALNPMPTDADDDDAWAAYEARQDALIDQAKEMRRQQAFLYSLRNARRLLAQDRAVLTPEAEAEMDALVAEVGGAPSPVFDHTGQLIKISDDDLARLLQG